MHIVLASASPRRRALLEMLGTRNLLVIPAEGEENPPEGLTPEETVVALARAKAAQVAAGRPPEDVVIGADTVVALEDQIFGKPASEDEAYRMLRALSGRSHRVYTGVSVMRGDEESACAVGSEVWFRDLSEEEIWAYIRTGEPMDKAGAYGIQGLASLFVERIDGDFYNVMGLPLCRLGKMLGEIGVRLI